MQTNIDRGPFGNFAILTVCLLVAFDCRAVLAADTALVVGVSDYALADAFLPGIQTDIEQLVQLARDIGFEEQHIHVLSGRDATLAGIRIAVQRYLIRGTQTSDRALFYFSGHGAQVADNNLDEPDGLDEALLPYDFAKRYSRGKTKLINVLRDDELAELLAGIPAEETLALIDACHSGTITRTVFGQQVDRSADWHSKAYFSEEVAGLPKNVQVATDLASRPHRFVSLAAAGDDELAIATIGGSIFTATLIEEFEASKSSGRSITLDQLTGLITKRIEKKVPPDKTFRPQLGGSSRKARDWVLTEWGKK